MPPQASNHLGERFEKTREVEALLSFWLLEDYPNTSSCSINASNQSNQIKSNQIKSNQASKQAINQSINPSINQSINQASKQASKRYVSQVTFHPIETKNLTSHCTPIIVDAIATDMGCSTSLEKDRQKHQKRLKGSETMHI